MSPLFSISEETLHDACERAAAEQKRTGATGVMLKRTSSSGGRWVARGGKAEGEHAR